MDTLKVLVYKIFLKVLVYKIFLKIFYIKKKKKNQSFSYENFHEGGIKTFMK